MVFGSSEIKLPSKLVITIIGCLLSAAITFNVWAVKSVYARPTHERVTEMIEDKSPYGKDRSMILQALEDIKLDIQELKNMLKGE